MPSLPSSFPLALAAAAPHSAGVRRPPALVAPQPRFALARDRRGNQKPSTPSCLCPLHDRRLALARRESAPPSPPPPPLFWSWGRGRRKAILPLGPCPSFFSFMNPFLFRSFSKKPPYSPLLRISPSTIKKIIMFRSLLFLRVTLIFSKNYNQALALSKIFTNKPLIPV